MKAFTTLFTAVALLAGTTVYSQNSFSWGGLFGSKVKASKNYVTKDIRVDNFTKVSVSGSMDVTFTQKAGRPKVEIFTSDNIVGLLDIRVKNGTLKIGFKKNARVSYRKLEVRLSAETLNSVDIAGSGKFTLNDGLKTQELALSVAGSGDIYADRISCTELETHVSGSGNISADGIDCSSLEGSISGSGDVKLLNARVETSASTSIAGSGSFTLSGKGQEAKYEIAGSGDIRAENFVATRVETSIAGSGDIKCHATDFLKVRNSGSGNVGYKGNPELDIPKKGLYKL